MAKSFIINKDYETFVRMLPNNVIDAFWEINKKTEPTFGVLDKKGNPTERVMTHKSDYGINECIDFVFTNLKVKNAEVDLFSERDGRKKWQ